MGTHVRPCLVYTKEETPSSAPAAASLARLASPQPLEAERCIEISAPREGAWRGLLPLGVLASPPSRGRVSREGLVLERSCAGPYQAVEVGHALGHRQASLGTPIPRMPTVAPRPKARSSWLRGEAKGADLSAAGPSRLRAQPDAWRVMRHGCLHFPKTSGTTPSRADMKPAHSASHHCSSLNVAVSLLLLSPRPTRM